MTFSIPISGRIQKDESIWEQLQNTLPLQEFLFIVLLNWYIYYFRFLGFTEKQAEKPAKLSSS